MTHEQLWAPWRLPYIVSNKDEMPGCFLCRFARQPAQDRENLVLGRSGNSIAILNRYPYNNCHLLVAPLEHKAQLADLTDAELLENMKFLRRMTQVMDKVLSPDGYNIGVNLGRAAGAGLPGHLHWHLIPRWVGDTNFMTVCAETNVIPQSLSAAWELLRQGDQSCC